MTPEKLREKPNTVRLRSGVQVVNGITGETGPTFSEYVLLSDYQELQHAHAAALEEVERLNAAWKAQQFHLEAEERESAHWKERAEKAERGGTEHRGLHL